MTPVHLTIRHFESLIQWLDSAVDGTELQANDRVRIAGACLDLAMEHHKAIILLAAHQLFGSAFALVRLTFEAYVRGVWLHRCASPAEISAFESGKNIGHFHELLSRVEAINGCQDGILSDAKQKSWRAMNDFTHSGYIHAMHRNQEATIEPNYSEEEILEVMRFANAVGLLSSFEAACLAENNKLAANILAKSREFWGARPQESLPPTVVGAGG
jgi:hypothetical protein